jgi:adenylate kinase
VKRLASRRICGVCGANADPGDGSRCPCGGAFVQRTDDGREVVLERLRVYQASTRPVLDYYRQRQTFRVVDGAQPQETVARALRATIDDAAGVRR